MCADVASSSHSSLQLCLSRTQILSVWYQRFCKQTSCLSMGFGIIQHCRLLSRRVPWRIVPNGGSGECAKCAGRFTKIIHECFCLETDSQFAPMVGLAKTASSVNRPLLPVNLDCHFAVRH